MPTELDLTPPRFKLSGLGGNDLSVKFKLAFDASTGVHVVYLSELPTGVAIETFTDGAGLTLTQVSGKTHVSVALPRDLTEEYIDKGLYLQYDLTMSSILRTQATAKLELKGGISAT
jgi:hypothetical protein